MLTFGLFWLGALLAATVIAVAVLTFAFLHERMKNIIKIKGAVIDSIEMNRYLNEMKNKGRLSERGFEEAIKKYSKPSVIVADLDKMGNVKKAEQIVHEQREEQFASFMNENSGVILVENDL